MLTVDPSGRLFFHLGTETVGLDCLGDFSFVSHAHFDHVPSLKRSKSVICSDPTIELIRARGAFGDVLNKTEEKLERGTLSLVESGHVLGSRMLKIVGDGGSFLYTADFKTEDSLLFTGAKPIATDTLLIESTYGMPRFSFPKREEVYSEITSWVRSSLATGCVVLGGYPLGKAQEIIKVLNDQLGIVPVISDEIADICEVYAKHGSKLDYVRSSSPEGVSAFGRSFVAVLPQNKVNSKLAASLSSQYGKKFHTAVATGWAASPNWGFDVDRAFCLSDHADYAALVEFAEGCTPRKIFVNHGYARELARELTKKGFDAKAVEEMRPAKGQQTLVATQAKARA